MFGSKKKRETEREERKTLVMLAKTLQRDNWEYERRLGEKSAELFQIKIALEQVAVYEGMVDVSPVALLVSELVRDHEELEARIDACVALLQGAKEAAEGEPSPLVDEVARLLQGGNRVPDDPSQLLDDPLD